MATVAYTKTVDKQKGTDDVLAKDINDLRAEVKAAIDGIATHDIDIATTYIGWKVNTITLTDQEGDANLDTSCVITYTWSGLKPTQRVTVFSVLGIILTEAYTFVGWKWTATARTLS